MTVGERKRKKKGGQKEGRCVLRGNKWRQKRLSKLTKGMMQHVKEKGGQSFRPGLLRQAIGKENPCWVAK